MRWCFFLLLNFLVNPVLAESCENIRDLYEQGYCFNKAYYEVDEELNANYKKLTALLSKSQIKKLEDIQINWIKERDSFCAIKKDNKILTDMKCAVEKTMVQAEFLKDQIDVYGQGAFRIASGNEKHNPMSKVKFLAKYYKDKKFIASEMVDAISINYAYDQFKGIPSESFSATWEANIKVKEDTYLIFSTASSWSSTSVYVDDEQLASWSDSTQELVIKLSKGKHKIKVENHNNWHTVEFNASFFNYPKLIAASAAQNVAPFINDTTKVLYIGTYEPKNAGIETVIKINKSKSPLVIFLSSHEVMRWKIENPYQVKINAIFFNSYRPGSSVSASDENVQIFKLDGLSYEYKDFTDVSTLIQQLTGLMPSYLYGEHSLAQVEIPRL